MLAEWFTAERNPSRRIDSHSIARHFLCEHLVRNSFQIDDCAVKGGKNL